MREKTKVKFILLISVTFIFLGIALICFNHFFQSDTSYMSEAKPVTNTEATDVSTSTNVTKLPINYTCFSDGSNYGKTDSSSLDYSLAAEFEIDRKGEKYEGWETFASKVYFTAKPLPKNNEIGDYKISSDWANKLDLTYMGFGEKDISSISNAGKEVGYGLMVVKTEYDDGSTTLNAVCLNFFKSSVDGNPQPFCMSFEANGKYTVSLFFEAKGNGGNNHRLDVKFRIINKYSDSGVLNSIIINNLGSGGGNVPKNGVTCNNFQINFNNLKHMKVTYYNAEIGIKSKQTAYDGKIITKDGKYIFNQKIGPFYLESFTVTLDRRTPSANFGNIKSQTESLISAEGYVTISWTVGNAYQWPIACEIYNRDTYTDNTPGTLLGRDLSGNMVINVPGRYKVLLRFDNNNKLLASGFCFASYNVDVEDYAKPTVNYEALSAPRFNYAKTKWYELEYNGETHCFYDYDSATRFAMSIEDEIVKSESSFRGQYYNSFSEICIIYNKYDGNHEAKIAAIRHNTDDNMVLTEVMNNRAAQRIKANYFKCDDNTSRLFEEASMFDNGHLYLDDEFCFVQKGEWESSLIKYRNCATGETGTLPYGVPISQTGLPDGKYEIIETDRYGNQTEYTVYRDLSAPVVMIAQNGGSVCQAIEKSYSVDYFSVASFADEYDPWAVLKINSDYYVGNEIPEVFYESGNYEISCYDRNKNVTSFSVNIKERRLQPVISANNGSNEFLASNGGSYTLYNFSISLLAVTYPDVFYDIAVNGVTTSYGDVCKTERKSGVYSIRIVDKYSGASIDFGIRIAEREMAPILVWDNNEQTRITQNARYEVNRFRIDYDADYIGITGIPSYDEYITACGTYRLTATDIYNGCELTFTVIVEDKDISLATKVDFDREIVLSGNEYVPVKRFSVNRLTEEQLYYMSVRINGKDYDNSGRSVTDFGIYKIAVVNKFSGKGYESTFIIENRALELAYRVNNDIPCVNDEIDSKSYNFIIDTVPEYLYLYINGKRIESSDLPIKYVKSGRYDFSIVDKYNLDQVDFSIELAERYMPKIIYDGFGAQSITKREYTVRRFKIADKPDYVEVTLNGQDYKLDGYIVDAGVYDIEIRDIYSEEFKSVTVTVDGEETEVTLVYDDNLKTKLTYGCDYDLYRFRISPLIAEKAAYTQISVNGEPYKFGDYISDFGTYEISVADLYKGTEERVIIHIAARGLEADIFYENGEIKYSDGGAYIAKKFTVDNYAEYMSVTVNDVAIAVGSAQNFYEFGEYSIVVSDKYNNAKSEFSIVIADRSIMPDIKVNRGTALTAENGGAYYVYKFSITAAEHQEIDVNGVVVKNGIYTDPGNYKIRVKDIYSGKVSNVDITVKETTDTPDIFVDFGERKIVANGEDISVYRFKIEYAEPYQNEYLDIFVNGKPFQACGRYIVESGVYDVHIKNTYSGKTTAMQVTVKDRSLYLPLVINNDKPVRVSEDIKTLRYKFGECDSLREYAVIHGAVFGDYNINTGVYEYNITDRFTNDTLTVRIYVVDVCEYIGFAYNKKVVVNALEIALDHEIMDVLFRVDGRDTDTYDNVIKLTVNGEETHYYLRIRNKFVDTDVYEIYVIIKGNKK